MPSSQYWNSLYSRLPGEAAICIAGSKDHPGLLGIVRFYQTGEGAGDAGGIATMTTMFVIVASAVIVLAVAIEALVILRWMKKRTKF